MLPVEQPFKTYTGLDGKPLDNGYIYFGLPNQDPANVSQRVTVYWDAAGTQPAAQPLRTVNGYIINDSGSPANVFFDGAYSELVRDSRMRQVFYARTSDDFSISTLVLGLAKSFGSSLIGFIQAGLGAVVMTVQAKLRQSVHVKDFGASVDAPDNRAAIQKALDASLFVDFGGPDDNYLVSGRLNLRDGHFVFGKGATITQTSANTEIFNFEGKSNIHGMGLKLVGKGDYMDSDFSHAAGFYGGTSGSNNHIFRCRFLNFGYAGARFHGQQNCSFTFNTVEGPGSPTLTPISSGRNYGVLFDTGCVGALVHGNDITKTGQGVRIEGTANCRITSNNLHDITGQHGIYAGSALKNLVIASNTIDNTALIGIKVQAQDTAGVDNLTIAITGNTVTNYGDQGILVCSAVSPATYKCRGVAVTGNTIRQGAGSGINLNNTIGAVVNSNTVDLAGFSGINFSECSNLKVDANFVMRSGLSAIRDGLPCTHVSITNNQVVDCATKATAADRYGILIQGGSEYNITGNDISDANAKMDYALYIAGGTTSAFCVDDNTGVSTTGYAFRVDPAGALRSYRDNYFAGAVKATYNDPAPATVTAAANISLPASHRAVRVTGTTPITYIDPNGQSGNVIVLMTDAGVNLVDNSNLRLNGNFVATTDDTITLACDGGNWYEVARSAN